MSPEHKRWLERLREISVEIEELQERHAVMAGQRGRGAISRELQLVKAQRRTLVRTLARDGADFLAIAHAAHLTRSRIVELAGRP